jgi:stearoyl-CoA desaturase (delta-9 desaturase)
MRPTPSITVDNAALRAAQRRMAIATVVVPFIGTLAAVALAFVNGIAAADIWLLVIMYLLTSVGIEVGLHRGFAHRAFEMTTALKVALAVLGSMAAEGSVLYWAAGHRRHHSHSDTGGDPHSPHVRNLRTADEPLGTLRGLWHSHVGWMMTDKVTNCTLFARDIVRDPLLNRIHLLYVPIVISGLAIPAIAGGLLTGTWLGALNGFLWGGLVRMFLVHHSTWSNASFSHVYGSRPFATGDLSANNAWCALPTFGASWQNNHHMFPRSAYLGLEWWQVDLGAIFIRLFAALGWIWNIQHAPTPEMMAARRVPEPSR